MATMIGFSGPASLDGRHVFRSQLGERLDVMRISAGLDWRVMLGGNPEFLFTSPSARTPPMTRKVAAQLALFPRSIYDYSDLFLVLASRDPAITAVTLQPIDMDVERIRIIEKAAARADRELASTRIHRRDATEERPWTVQIQERAAARIRMRARDGEGLTYETIPRHGRPVPRDMVYMNAPLRMSAPVTVEDMTHTHTIDRAALLGDPALRPNVTDEAIGEAAGRIRDRVVRRTTEDATTRREAANAGMIEHVRRMLIEGGIDPTRVTDIRGLEGVTAEQIRAWHTRAIETIAEQRGPAWAAVPVSTIERPLRKIKAR